MRKERQVQAKCLRRQVHFVNLRRGSVSMGVSEKDLLEFQLNPEAEARARALGMRFTQALLSLVRDCKGGFKGVAQDANLSPTYFYRIQSGERKPSFGIIAKILGAVGLSLEAFARRLLELEWDGHLAIERSLTAAPAELLNDWREPGAETGSPFLEKLGVWLGKIDRLELSKPRIAPAWRPIVLAMEEERLRDWRKSRQRLEKLVLRFARKLARQEKVSRVELADLATLVAAWAAVQRVAGLRGYAIDGLTVALSLAERSEDVWAEGFCLQKAAYLTHDLGRSAMASAMVNKAALCFSEVGSSDDRARILIDRGYFSYYCGRKHEAQRLLENGLRRIDPNHRLYVASAHLALARISREHGDTARASRELKAAIDCHTPASIEAGYTAWEAAQLEAEFNQLEVAENLLQEALRIFAQLGRAGDIACVALDYAEILMRNKRISDMQVLVRDVLGWLEPMAQSSRSLAKVFENLAALLVLGKMTRAEIDSARDYCKKAAIRPQAED